MIPQLQLLPNAISELSASVAETGVLTLSDRYGLMAAVLDESLDEDARMYTNRLLRSAIRGKVKLVNEFRTAA